MHVYFLTRGHYDKVNRFIQDLLAQKYDRDYGKKGKFKIGWHVRPIQLWEIAVPKECFDEVLSTLQPYDSRGIPSSFLWAVRKALDLKPINKLMPDNFRAKLPEVQVCGIGWKEDKESDEGLEYV